MTVSKKQQKDNLLAKITSSLAEKTAAEMANVEPEKIRNYKQAENTKEPDKKINFHLNIPSKKLHKELKQLALNENSSIAALFFEGISLVLKKRGKSMDDYL